MVKNEHAFGDFHVHMHNNVKRCRKKLNKIQTSTTAAHEMRAHSRQK